jgi:hypothetical protein
LGVTRKLLLQCQLFELFETGSAPDGEEQGDRAEIAPRFNVADAAKDGRRDRQERRSAWQVLEGMPSGRQRQAVPLHRRGLVEFVAMHDFGGGTKGAGFQLKEMGEDGKGSLEPGVASGAVFVMAYPTPFCEYYWFANRTELDADRRIKLFPNAELAGSSEAAAAGDAPAEDGGAKDGAKKVVVKSENVEKPPLFEHLELVTSTLNVEGRMRGQYTNKYTCKVMTPKGLCGCSVTLYATGDGKAETTSNAWAHLRAKAGGCPEHAQVLAALNEHNPKVVKNADGEFVRVMSFEEAFPHHVDYVLYTALAPSFHGGSISSFLILSHPISSYLIASHRISVQVPCAGHLLVQPRPDASLPQVRSQL